MIDGRIFDLTYAVDFLCSIGTPIKAAEKGIVVEKMEGVTVNYDKPEPPPEHVLPSKYQDGNYVINYVIIKHENEEYSMYSHLSEVVVNVEEMVKEGQIIGYSGHTEWSIKPHLHFVVFKPIFQDYTDGWESLEIRWYDKL